MVISKLFEERGIYKEVIYNCDMSGVIDNLLMNSLQYLPGIGAAALSLRNFFELKRGANIQPLPIVNYGLWAIKSSDKRNKAFILPMVFSNDGVKNGLIVGVEVAFETGDDFKTIQLRRKIRLNNFSEQEIRNMNLADFRNKYLSSINPMYPISVTSKEATKVLFEGFDGEDIIPIGKKTTCRITLVQHNGRKNVIKFPFFITQDQFDISTNNLTWI